MIPLLKDISAIPKRIIPKIGINRAVIRSNSINLRELNKRKGKESEGEKTKRENEN